MMESFLRKGLVLLLAAGAALAVPVARSDVCTLPKTRRAWHTLSDAEKKAYIDAELCLMSKPTTLHIRGSRTKFDDFQAAHALKMEIAHFVGQFLPFHRLFLWAHEQALERECGYTAGQPYWEEQVDFGAFSKSNVLDPVLGFGGDGVAPDRCIKDGPFANYTNSVGPGYAINDHCITRRISDAASGLAAPAVIDACMNATNFLTFWPCIEGGPHGAGHGGIGEQMVNPVSSPGDPIFFLHHAWLDRLWAKWQLKDLEARLKDIGGNNRANLSGFGGLPPGSFPGGFPGGPGGGFPGGPGGGGAGGGFPGGPGGGGGGGFGGPPGGGGGFEPVNLTRPADVPEPLVIGDAGNTTTLNHLLYLYGLAENRTIGEVMDTNGFLCYNYD